MPNRRSESQLETPGKVLRCVQACLYVVCVGEEGRKQLGSVGLECAISRIHTHTHVCVCTRFPAGGAVSGGCRVSRSLEWGVIAHAFERAR